MHCIGARHKLGLSAASQIVDISPSGGAMKVGQKSDNDLGVGVVGKVGTEDADTLNIFSCHVLTTYCIAMDPME
jgi:hypothetical protein